MKTQKTKYKATPEAIHKPDESSEFTDKRKKNQRKRATKDRIMIIIVILLLLLLLFFGYFLVKKYNDKPSLDIDSGAVIGTVEPGTPHEEIVDMLNQTVTDSLMNIAIRTAITFADGESEGVFNIANADTNKYPQIVEIVDDASGRSIYKSGIIPVGHKIETAKLSYDLKPGTYNCTATFSAIDMETGGTIGKVKAEIIVYVIN